MDEGDTHTHDSQFSRRTETLKNVTVLKERIECMYLCAYKKKKQTKTKHQKPNQTNPKP